MTRQRLYLETMQQIYANTSKVMVDTKGSGNLLYLPLDKLMQCHCAATAVTAPSEVVPDRSVGSRHLPMENRDVRTRGSLGSRERGER